MLSNAKFLETFKNLRQNQDRTIRNIITILFVLALEALVSSEGFFECPADNHARYGWVFILVPAIILALLSVMLSKAFVDLIQGVCYYKKSSIPCGKAKCSILKIGDSKFFEVVYLGLAAASLWLFWAFLQGRYYACAKEGNKEDRLRPFKDNKNETDMINKAFTQAKTESQIIGFAIIAVWVGFSSLVLTFHKCCCKRPVSSIQSPEEFLGIEEKEAAKTYKEELEKLAKKRGKNKATKMFEVECTSKSPTEMLIDVYNKFKKKSGYEKAFADDYDKQAAVQHKEAFDAKHQAQAKADIEAMLSQSPCSKDEYCRAIDAYNAMGQEYPRTVVGHSKPYIGKSPHRCRDVIATNEGDVEMQGTSTL